MESLEKINLGKLSILIVVFLFFLFFFPLYLKAGSYKFCETIKDTDGNIIDQELKEISYPDSLTNTLETPANISTIDSCGYEDGKELNGKCELSPDGASEVYQRQYKGCTGNGYFPPWDTDKARNAKTEPRCYDTKFWMIDYEWHNHSLDEWNCDGGWAQRKYRVYSGGSLAGPAGGCPNSENWINQACCGTNNYYEYVNRWYEEGPKKCEYKHGCQMNQNNQSECYNEFIGCENISYEDYERGLGITYEDCGNPNNPYEWCSKNCQVGCSGGDIVNHCWQWWGEDDESATSCPTPDNTWNCDDGYCWKETNGEKWEVWDGGYCLHSWDCTSSYPSSDYCDCSEWIDPSWGSHTECYREWEETIRSCGTSYWTDLKGAKKYLDPFHWTGPWYNRPDDWPKYSQLPFDPAHYYVIGKYIEKECRGGYTGYGDPTRPCYCYPDDECGPPDPDKVLPSVRIDCGEDRPTNQRKCVGNSIERKWIHRGYSISADCQNKAKDPHTSVDEVRDACCKEQEVWVVEEECGTSSTNLYAFRTASDSEGECHLQQARVEKGCVQTPGEYDAHCYAKIVWFDI